MPMKFSEIAYEWLATKEGKIKSSSFASYASALNFNVLPILGDKTVVTEGDVQEMIVRLKEGGIREPSMRNYTTLVRYVLKYGAEKGYCDYPAWNIPVNTRSAAKGVKYVLLSQKEEDKLVGYLVNNPTPRNLGYLIVLATGIKAGELYALKWGAIDFKKGYLNVVDSKNQYYLPDAQGGKSKMKYTEDTDVRLRRIPLPAKLSDYLSFFAKGKDANAYVITGTTVLINRPKSFRDGLKMISKRLELPSLSPQDLRHTFAVRCIQAGCNLVTLMSLLGVTEVKPLFEVYGPYYKSYPQDAMTARVAVLPLPK